VSTWGTGLFASDGAQDFLEELAELDADDRVPELGRVLREVLDDPSALMRTVFPESLIAAAAVVALSLPGGPRIMVGQSDYIVDAVAAAALDRAAPELATNALRAIAVVTAPDGFWSNAWRDSGDKDEALAGVAIVREVLESAQ
jgi:hypothetical protein